MYTKTGDIAEFAEKRLRMNDEGSLERLLDSVAREVFSESLNSPELIQKTIPAVLKRRLLPLLEVGQYYRDCIAGEDKEACAENDKAWDAAKQKAMEGR